MNTIANIDLIQRAVPDESRATILDILNEIQLIAYSQDCIQTQKIDSNGMPPLLVTTSGVYSYDCPSDCRRTGAVFTLNSTIRDRSRPTGPRREYYFKNKGYYGVAVSSRDALVDSVATLKFLSDPGDTTDVYYHLYYIKPTPITAESIELTLPEETHYLLRKAVIAMLTTEKYGQSNLDEQIIERVARKIRNSLNRGAQGNIGMTPIQEEFISDQSGYRYGLR